MKGLILTSYYQVYRSIFAYTGLAILLSGIILYFGDSSIHGLAAMFIILLMTLPATEVIKLEAKSGYNNYVLTLPVSRRDIVKSHYLFYLIILIAGALLCNVIFYFYNLISETPVANIFNVTSFGVFIVLFAGSIIYPLLYAFGPEKSDAIVIGSGLGGLFATIGSQSLIGYLITQFSITSINLSVFISTIYLLLGIAFYSFSYFISAFIYQRKEF